MTSREPDVVIVGAGPAGSSVAALVKKYAPSSRVVLIERDPFPRHHIGESFVADVNRLLYDLGVYDRVSRAGFVPKHGSTFVWGRDREPWSVEFQDLRAVPGYRDGRGYQTGHTWHVRRDVYDALLLDHARERGAEVIEAAATIELGEATQRPVVQLADGTTLHPRFVVDATGQGGQIARRTGTLSYDPEIRNAAVYAYYEGARLDPALSGTWEQSRIAVVSVDEGWIWYIPVAPGLLSVGVVTSAETLARRPAGSLADAHDSVVRACSEIQPLLAGATRVRFPGAPSDVLLARDYCYSVARVQGPGWALCGDAAGFVDPILSIGCYLAHAGASHLAYVLCTLLSDAQANEALCFRAYEEQIQFALRAFRRMTYMFYGFNASKESWWWEAKRILAERAMPSSVQDKSAFLALATGYGINRPVYQEAISDFGVNLFEDFYAHLVAPESIKSAAHGARPRGSYRLRVPMQEEPWVVPVEGTGRMRSVSRITFPAAQGGADLPARLLVPSSYGRFLASLADRPVETALATLCPPDQGEVRPRVDSFVAGLVDMGVLERVGP